VAFVRGQAEPPDGDICIVKLIANKISQTINIDFENDGAIASEE
jgi:hypothetical protein